MECTSYQIKETKLSFLVLAGYCPSILVGRQNIYLYRIGEKTIHVFDKENFKLIDKVEFNDIEYPSVYFYET
jgi:hypothetical protein